LVPSGFILNIANIWFGEEVHSTEFNLKAALNKQAGIEVFLSHYGVGVLSITLTAQELSDFDELKRFNYRLSQGKDNKIPPLSLPLPQNIQKWRKICQKRQPQMRR
jgi:hypothetical protein